MIHNSTVSKLRLGPVFKNASHSIIRSGEKVELVLLKQSGSQISEHDLQLHIRPLPGQLSYVVISSRESVELIYRGSTRHNALRSKERGISNQSD